MPPRSTSSTTTARAWTGSRSIRAKTWGPAWSPDGEKLVFARNRDDNFDLWVMSADGTGITPLAEHPGDDGFPSWSPDGKRSPSPATGTETSRSTSWPLTAVTERLTNNAADDLAPHWSPNGRKIVFDRSVQGTSYDLYVMKRDGGEAAHRRSRRRPIPPGRPTAPGSSSTAIVTVTTTSIR